MVTEADAARRDESGEQLDSNRAAPVSLEPTLDGPVAVPAENLPRLTDEIVRATIERLRR